MFKQKVMVRYSKKLGEKDKELLQYLHNEEIEIFSFNQLRKIINCNKGMLQTTLEKLVSANFLSRIERGKYCLPSFRNEFVIGTFIAPNSAIGYWSALHWYGLTDRFPNSVFIQSPKIKSDKEIFGVQYKFIKIKLEKISGVIEKGNRGNKFLITDKEKTLVDCFDLPQYAGSYSDLIRAFSQAEIDETKLIEYCKKINNISAMKRMGFLASLVKKPDYENFLVFVKTNINKRYTLFDPAGQNTGQFDKEWNLRLNISKVDLEEILVSTY